MSGRSWRDVYIHFCHSAVLHALTNMWALLFYFIFFQSMSLHLRYCTIRGDTQGFSYIEHIVVVGTIKAKAAYKFLPCIDSCKCRRGRPNKHSAARIP